MDYSLSNSSSPIQQGKGKEAGKNIKMPKKHSRTQIMDTANLVYVVQPHTDRTRSTRVKQKSRPSLNNSDLDYSLAMAANSSKKNQKVNLNHLLNFSFPERQAAGGSVGKRFAYQPAFNKERFVNANFRFIMKPGFNDREHLVNPDLIVKWEQVVQMVIPSSETVTCPICLSAPTAPRAAKCGHLFCMPCIQHYVALSEHSWRKCPICFESIYSAALKPVMFLPTKAYDASKLGPSSPTNVEFTLMRRDLSSTIGLPIISYRKWKSLIPSVDLVAAMNFSKFLIASPEYLKSLNTSDRDALSTRLADIVASGEESYESSFIEICLELLQKELDELSVEDKGKKAATEVVVPGNDTDCYYFYQASDGQHIYLHPLDIKVLKQEFGSYQDFPSHLKLPIISLRESTVNADLRKRCKYLSHLPLSCDVSFCEVDLTDIVSASTLGMFESELTERTEKLLYVEKQRAKEALRSTTTSIYEAERIRDIADTRQNNPPMFDFSSEDFGPPLASSPEYPTPTVASSPSVSFARMAVASPASSWGRPSRSVSSALGADDEVSTSGSGWKLEIPDNVFAALATTPPSASSPVNANRSSGKKKKNKGVMLFGNGGSRGALFH